VNMLPMVSVIIPAYNEEKNIGRLLESIAAQAGLNEEFNCEIIVVDNGSTDKTVDYSRTFGAKVYIRPDASIADLRNYGASCAFGEFLLFSDADNIFTTSVVRTVIAIFNTESCHAIGPDGLRPVEPVSWMQRIWYFHTRLFDKPNQSMAVDNLSSGFFAVRRDVFDQVDGFNGALSIGEDSDLSLRLRAKGFLLLRTNRFLIFNSGHPANILAFVKREFWHGDSIGLLLQHKNIDLLTMYLFLHFFGVVTLVYCLSFGVNIYLSILLITLIGAAPSYKSFKKLGGFKEGFFSLSGVYFLYLCSRAVALFKNFRPKQVC